ncbi:dienelactone hydrolase family protein [Bradyrhizobium sp. HKCCYLS20291]|uniref:dienelactone hydrolase family protein n=1 Tax=Bradyrhizobium sp. HKCCYLS20291 TaxID=3420766 RepID=UPI003EB70BEA
MTSRLSTGTSEVTIPPADLVGTLTVPQHARGLIIFAHGSGSSRQSPRNQAVAGALNELTFATLLFDLLTPTEEADRANVFDISLLAERLVNVVQWLGVQEPSIAALPVGLFGASTGAAAALVTAARLPERVRAVVSRGGRPDLAGHALPMVRSPTLLIVGGADFSVIELNQAALTQLAVPKALKIIPGATHLFSELGAMDAVIAHAAHWFEQYLTARGQQGPRTK